MTNDQHNHVTHNGRDVFGDALVPGQRYRMHAPRITCSYACAGHLAHANAQRRVPAGDLDPQEIQRRASIIRHNNNVAKGLPGQPMEIDW